MTKSEFEVLIKSHAIANIIIMDRRKQGESFELYSYGYLDEPATAGVIEQIGHRITTDDGYPLVWPELLSLIDYIIDAGWRNRIEIVV